MERSRTHPCARILSLSRLPSVSHSVSHTLSDTLFHTRFLNSATLPTAYSIVISNKIPILGYLTLLDKYILGIFSFIIGVVLEIAALEWVEAPVETQRWVMYGDIGVWLLANVYFICSVAYSRRYQEGQKGKALQRQISESKVRSERRASFTLDGTNPLTFTAVSHVASLYPHMSKKSAD